MSPATIEPERIDNVSTDKIASAKTTSPKLVEFDAHDPNLKTASIVEALKHEGAVVVRKLVSKELTTALQRQLSPLLDLDIPKTTSFFPTTTQSISGLIGKSPSSVELLTIPLVIDVVNAVLSSTFKYRLGEEVKTATTKPILGGTAAFRIKPGSRNQVLHRDDNDYHPYGVQRPVQVGAITAMTRTTKANGATRFIPGSHKWPLERVPQESEVVYAEQNIGDTFIFLADVYHGGSANTTEDEDRETVGMFYCRGFLRPNETMFLSVSLQQAAQFTPQVQRLLGYGISAPGLGNYEYQDPMRVLFKVEDEETVDYTQ